MVGSLQSAAEFKFCHDHERQRTVLSHRQAGGLCHVSKPYWDETVLGVQVLNPTAGFFAGDAMGLRVEVGEGARVAMTSPSATRFYSMEDGKASLRQEFEIGKGAWLEYRPDWIIPQDGSEVEQVTRLEIAKGGETVFFDRLAPGRVAHGEQYRYRSYQTLFELSYGGELVARERMSLKSDQGGWPLAVPDWEVTYYGAVWLAGENVEKVEDALSSLENELSSSELRCGWTRLAPEVATVRVLTARSLLLKSALAEVRKVLEPHFPLLEGGKRTL